MDILWLCFSTFLTGFFWVFGGALAYALVKFGFGLPLF